MQTLYPENTKEMRIVWALAVPEYYQMEALDKKFISIKPIKLLLK